MPPDSMHLLTSGEEAGDHDQFSLEFINHLLKVVNFYHYVSYIFDFQTGLKWIGHSAFA